MPKVNFAQGQFLGNLLLGFDPRPRDCILLPLGVYFTALGCAFYCPWVCILLPLGWKLII